MTKITAIFQTCVFCADMPSFTGPVTIIIITVEFLSFDAKQIHFSCAQDNVLIKYKNQDLDGDGIIELTGQGSVYILQVANYLKIEYLAHLY